MKWDWMEDVNFVTDVGLIILVCVVLSSYWGAYRLGRYLERKEYTAVFIKEVEASYFSGFDDGKEYERKIAYNQGYKSCLNDDFKASDRY